MKIETQSIHAGLPEARSGEPVLSPLVPASSFYAHPDDIGFSANDLNDKSGKGVEQSGRELAE